MKRALLAATAVLSSSFAPVAMTPAYATEILLTPIQDYTGLTAQEVCEEVLRPAEPSGFHTYPGAVTEGTWVNDGDLEIGNPIGDASPYGTPTYTNIFLTSGFYRNGGSPNVWGGATATAIYPQTQQMHETSQAQLRTNTFDCIVEKDPGGTEHGPDEIFPPGLQTTGNSVTEHQTVPGPDQNVITDDDFIIEGETVYALICISPNKSTKGKPGTWTGKHGFDAADCPAASLAAGESFIPSGNAPTIN